MTQPAKSAKSGATICNGRRSCCKRHPKAADCGKASEAMLSSAADAGSSSTLQLREDLFLVAGGPLLAADAGSPPAVVRSYEACDADASSQVRAAANRTRAARVALMASPLPIVAVIFFGTHLERLPLLRAYELYFERVVYMAPTAKIATALRSSAAANGARRYRRRAVATAEHCISGLKATYACVARVAAACGSSARGVLYWHFDLWVKPWKLIELASGSAAATGHPSWSKLLDALWTVPEGRMMLKASGPTRLLPLRCFNASRPQEYASTYPQWTWARDVPHAHAAVRRACTDGACDPDRLCIGWADLYYVPRRHFARFGMLARSFAATTANAELAVPTMISLLAEPTGESVHRPACWGFCCSQTLCPELLSRYPCGHRMQLSNQAMRRAFSDLWT